MIHNQINLQFFMVEIYKKSIHQLCKKHFITMNLNLEIYIDGLKRLLKIHQPLLYYKDITIKINRVYLVFSFKRLRICV